LVLVSFTGLLGPRPAQAQTVNQLTTTTSGAITDLSCNQPIASQIVRNFTVSSAFVVGDVDLGILLSHTYRSDLRIFLTSPTGTVVSILPWTTNVQDGNNLNDLFDDEAAASITTHVGNVNDPVTPAPPYSHSFRPANPFSAFDGQNAAGTWTLRICDAVSSDTGSFTRADLYITSTSVSVTKTSSVISDGVSGANPKFVPGAVVRYCIVITNNGKSTAPNATVNHTMITSSDVIPAMESYVTGSMLSGTSCAGAATIEDDDNVGADETDPFGMAISGSTITGNTPSLAPGATFAMVFRVTIN
jgi:uncharacterized repeat protein (TIGR01451 family)